MLRWFLILQLLHFMEWAFSQSTPNTLSVMVNDKEYKAEPRQVHIGQYSYVTGNTINPDKSLRFWIATIDGSVMKEPGLYLVIGENDNYNKNDAFQKEWLTGKYKGILAIKYVEETKSPRMQYHVGESGYNGESVKVDLDTDGYLSFSFDASLNGSWWNEKSSATAFGGVGRFMGKMEDKAVTGATGYDQNIDPEGAGYKKQKETDTIHLKNGVVRLKVK